MDRYNSGTIDFQEKVDEDLKWKLIIIFGHNQLLQSYKIYQSTLELIDFPGDIGWAVEAVVTIAEKLGNPVTDISIEISNGPSENDLGGYVLEDGEARWITQEMWYFRHVVDDLLIVEAMRRGLIEKCDIGYPFVRTEPHKTAINKKELTEKTKVFISIPMAGKTERQIKDEMEEIRKDACDRLDKSPDEVEFLDSFFKDYKPESGNVSMKFLAKSIMCLADADCIYMAPGWDAARGCMIEYTCASEYGLRIIEGVHRTTRREMQKLTDGDRFYIYGVWHTAKGDAHLSSDTSCPEYLVYDTNGVSYYESEFPETCISSI